MYGHERALVEELKGKPFALVGVNVADELETIRNVAKEKNFNWRSFFIGEDEAVVKGFKVRGFPTVMIIDSEGVVRWVGHGENDKLIHELLEEMAKP